MQSSGTKKSLTTLLIAAVLLNLPNVASAKPKSRKPGKGPQWTILALELQGPSGGRNIQRFAETLKNTPGIYADEVFVRESPDVARLYYGVYGWPEEKKGGRTPMPEQMRSDLALLKQLGDPTGGKYFLRALPVRMPTPDVGNPDWALSNARGLYTLQVGVFEPAGDFTEYKEAAAEFCKLLREKGYEAWYHHTDAASMVTVGAFGKEAIVEPTAGAKRSSPGSVAIPVYHPRIIEMQKQELLQYNLLNGGIQYVLKPDGSRVPVLSRLVEIPQTKKNLP